MNNIFKFIIMLGFIIYSGFKSGGISGVVENLNALGMTIKELLGILNIFSLNITGDGVLTGFFLHYIVYGLVGVAFELFNIKRGYRGKLFGKVAYLIIGIPVSFILNCLNLMIFG